MTFGSIPPTFSLHERGFLEIAIEKLLKAVFVLSFFALVLFRLPGEIKAQVACTGAQSGLPGFCDIVNQCEDTYRLHSEGDAGNDCPALIRCCVATDEDYVCTGSTTQYWGYAMAFDRFCPYSEENKLLARRDYDFITRCCVTGHIPNYNRSYFYQSCEQSCWQGGPSCVLGQCTSGFCSSTDFRDLCPTCTGSSGNLGICSRQSDCTGSDETFETNNPTCNTYPWITSPGCCVQPSPSPTPIAPSPTPTPIGGDCATLCTDSSQCISGFECLGSGVDSVCTHSTHPNFCPPCTGASGYSGACYEAEPSCENQGQNYEPNDYCNGVMGGGGCCTNAPTGDNCVIWFLGDFQHPPEDNEINFFSTTPNTYYTLGFSGSGPNSDCTCTEGSCWQFTTGPLGTHSFRLSCGEAGDTITLSVLSGPARCSRTFVVGGGIPINPGSGLFCEDPINHFPFAINTAIGCVPTNTILSFLDFVFPRLLGISGGVALILIIYAGFIITTSAGDSRKLAAGKELLTAAISGVILLGLSVFILKLIGMDILRIPGLGGPL